MHSRSLADVSNLKFLKSIADTDVDSHYSRRGRLMRDSHGLS